MVDIGIEGEEQVAVAAREWIESVTVEPAITQRWPDYGVVLVAADGLDPGALGDVAERLVEEAGRSALSVDPDAPDPHVLLWREAFRSFGVAPRVARSSIDALLRRASGGNGLPRLGTLIDLYNAISVIHRVPIGGEDLASYSGAARLVISDGTESFLTTADGEPVVHHPDVGEPVWVDEDGVTCRRWNWRQTTRTAISPTTTDVGFIIDSLDVPGHRGARGAAEALAALLPGAVVREVLP